MTSIQPVGLRCEYLVNPLGIDELEPRLSWRLESGVRDQRQSAYQVQVASSRDGLLKGHADLWDSGRVAERDTCAVYSGLPLRSRMSCHWRIRCWDASGTASKFSDPATWEMGLLEPLDWTARWIQDPARIDAEHKGRPSCFRHEFELQEPVRVARIYATAHGLYRLQVNGAEVSDDLLRPGWTDYDVYTQYQVYDVRDHVRQGANVLAAVVADGWYSGQLDGANHFPPAEDPYSIPSPYGPIPRLLLQLEVAYAGGRLEIVGSNVAWRCSFGSWIGADLLRGETYDMQLLQPGWTSPGFDDTSWRQPEEIPGVRTTLVAQTCPPIRRILELPPIAQQRVPSGATVFDFGQNMAGWVRLRVREPAGTAVTLRHAEALDENGGVYVGNLGSALATDRYVCQGDTEESYEPSFTYHGFRYVEVSGLDKEVPADTVTGVVIHSDLPVVGEFECSDPFVNQLYRAIVWTQRAKFMDIPIDCPQRDERLGWMDDVKHYVRTACTNMDVAAFFTKWMRDVFASRSPEGGFPDFVPMPRFPDWRMALLQGAPGSGDAVVVIPWVLYLCYGETRILDRHFNEIAGWVDYVQRHNPDLVWRHRRGIDFGEWEDPGGEETSKELLATANFAHSTNLVARIAHLTGREEDAEAYRSLFERIRQAYQREYVDAEGRVLGDTQTGYVLTLAYDLAPETLRSAVGDHLVRRIEAMGEHPSVGFPGIAHLLPALTNSGHVDVAYRLLLQRSFPSWGYMLDHGATTMWENWDSWHDERGFMPYELGGSMNHSARGSIGEWLFATVAGIDIDPEQPGYRRVLVYPRPGGGLTWARGRIDSPAGPIRAEWRLSEGRGFELEVDIPANCTAQARIPANSGLGVTESGVKVDLAAGVHRVEATRDAVLVEMGSGSYRFRSPT